MSDASRNFEIVPAILTDDAAELDRLLTVVKDAGASRVHLDVIDGSLIEGKTVLGYRELAGRDLGMALDVHLMVDRPDEHLVGWEKVPNVSRVIVHVESHVDPQQIANDCRQKDRQWWGALNPDSPMEWLESAGFADCMHGAMFMTVVPGAQGRPFREDVLKRMRTWKQSHPHMPLMVDGGVTSQTAPQCVAAGADILAVGSFIVRSDNPTHALQELADAVRSSHA